jgi:hypothetical protein
MIPIHALGAVQVIAPHAVASVVMQEKSASGISAAPLARQLFAMGFAAQVPALREGNVARLLAMYVAMTVARRSTSAAETSAVI